MGNRDKQKHAIAARESQPSRTRAYELHSIRNAEFCTRTLQQRYLVRWEGYGEEHDSWAVASDLWGCPEKIKEYKAIIVRYNAHLTRYVLPSTPVYCNSTLYS